MIVLSTSALATDDSKLRCRRSKPPMPNMCFMIPIKAAAIFGVASTVLLSVAIYVYCMVHMLHTNPDPDAPQKIAILSVALVIILLFAILFVWGLFANRHRLLLAFTTLSCFLLFAVVGALIATLVTTVDELNSALSKADVGNSKQNLADLVIFRVVLGVTALVLALELYAYIRMFLYIKAVRRVMSR
ncbi:hypothetical protein OESDEN_05480 [Oesophagostomum dentatum]|uniref:Uncharacterized protein n=1 Tax=Oesophagostomum dentatum TaxID=61180 RepID=A0A0B1TFJ7_OESDE|nr:hypothetical protein OESDEN_05480 [Oesophagostomum dentatum]